MDLKTGIDDRLKDIMIQDELKEKILRETVFSRKSFWKKSTPQLAVAAIAFILLAGTIPAVANVPQSWAESVAKLFDADASEQKALGEKGYASIPKPEQTETTDTALALDQRLSSTCDNIQVTVEQTLVDKHGMYINLKFKDLTEQSLTQDSLNLSYELTLDGKAAPFDTYLTSHQGVSSSEYNSNMWLSAEEGATFIGSILSLQLQATEELSNGSIQPTGAQWNLQWKVSGVSDTGKIITLNSNMKQKGEDFYLQEIEVSPISYILRFKMPKNYDQQNSFTFNINFHMKDGTIFTPTQLDNKVLSDTGQNIIYLSGSQIVRFAKVLNLEQIEYIEIGGAQYVFQ